MRKRLKEEKELRWWSHQLLDDDRATKMPDEKEAIPNRKRMAKLITALIRAVRADEREKCAVRCDAMAAFYRNLRGKGEKEIGNIDMDTLRMFASEECAAAIREGK